MTLVPAGSPGGTPDPAVADQAIDRFVPAAPDRQRIDGLLGERMRINLEKRLLRVDEAALLEGYRQRPGRHPWIGEHAGKFLHAASNAWAYSGNEELRTLLDRMATELVAAQEPDGYLGTYEKEDRWTSWDVWSHKYNLLGLLRYYEVTGDKSALQASRRIGDLLETTFGDGEGRRDILEAGTHLGMASTSVLEPMSQLYRHTGDQRYLDFCRYLVRAMDDPEGPGIFSGLAQTGSVRETANAKAYEMLSNLHGLVELYRLTGEEELLEPVLTAWKDIASVRLYVTGTSSAREYFREDEKLPASETASVGEGCVTVTWLQLTWNLLRLTGEPRYGDELNRTVYNHLFAAQATDTGDVCYFVPLNGRRHPSDDISCCLSSVPRGIALLSLMVWGTTETGIRVNFYTGGEASLVVRNESAKVPVALRARTNYPDEGTIVLEVEPDEPAQFALHLPVPDWCRRFVAKTGPETWSGTAGTDLVIDRVWSRGDRVEIELDLTLQVLPGGRSFPHSVALQRGPQVLALEESLNPELPVLEFAGPARDRAEEIELKPVASPAEAWKAPVYALEGLATGIDDAEGRYLRDSKTLYLTPFAEARHSWVWLPRPGSHPSGPAPVTLGGTESASRQGNLRHEGPITDGRSQTMRSTRDLEAAEEDWFAVELAEPRPVGRIVYRHGATYLDGGWFDTSEAKPLIQIKRPDGASWETAGTLADYPQTTAKEIPDLYDGQPFTLQMPEPVTVTAVRVVGKPSHGNAPHRSFVTCAGLEAY